MRFGKFKPFLLLQIVNSQVITGHFFLDKLNVLDKRMSKWSCNSLNLGRAQITGISSTICSQHALSLDYRGCWENCKDSVYCYRNRTGPKLSMGFYWIFNWFWWTWTTMRQWSSRAIEVSDKFWVILPGFWSRNLEWKFQFSWTNKHSVQFGQFNRIWRISISLLCRGRRRQWCWTHPRSRSVDFCVLIFLLKRSDPLIFLPDVSFETTTEFPETTREVTTEDRVDTDGPSDSIVSIPTRTNSPGVQTSTTFTTTEAVLLETLNTQVPESNLQSCRIGNNTVPIGAHLR